MGKALTSRVASSQCHAKQELELESIRDSIWERDKLLLRAAMGRSGFPGDWTWKYEFLRVDVGSLAKKITEVNT